MATVMATQSTGLDCSKAEWEARVALAALYRAFQHYGWTDYIYTHLTARVPDEQNTYLINPYGLMFDEICASNLLKVAFDGHLISGDYPINDAGHLIHTAVLRPRADVNFVLHAHTRASCAVAAMKRGLLPLSQHAMVVMNQMAYHPYALVTEEAEDCERIAEDLGSRNCMLLLNHGTLVCGRTAGEAFYRHYYLEMACKIQVDVLNSGEEVVMPDERAVEAVATHGDDSVGPGEEGWPALIRLLDRRYPDYKS